MNKKEQLTTTLNGLLNDEIIDKDWLVTLVVDSCVSRDGMQSEPIEIEQITYQDLTRILRCMDDNFGMLHHVKIFSDRSALVMDEFDDCVFDIRCVGEG